MRRSLHSVAWGLTAFALAPTATADEPIWTPQGLVYPEGSRIPRSLTDVERAWIEQFGLRGPGTAARADGAPSGPLFCPAEYEPMEGIMFAWEGYSSLLTEMIANITTLGDADVWVYVDTGSEQNSASNTIAAGGADMDRVHFLVKTTDTVWIRDYGPRFVFQGDVRAIVDHVYNRPRPNDDTVPINFGSNRNHPVYALDLVHGGGNFHLDSLGRSYVTRLINNENPSLSETDIHDLWFDYQNVDTFFFEPYPVGVDSTQHIDMWMQIIADDKVVISDWPLAVGSTQDLIADGAAVEMAARGYTVYRVPAVRSSGTHYTFTNVVMCNDLVLLPSYTNSTAAPYNDDALAVWESALPDKTIVQIDAQSIVTAAGVLHCIVMHVPEARGNGNPSAYLLNLNGGEILTPGEVVTVEWATDDDESVSNVDILLSLDGGATFDTTVASATSDDGAFDWQVPNVYSAQARLRVVSRDAAGNTGSDDSDADFTINGTPTCVGDLDGDSVIGLSDLGLMLSVYGTCVGDPAFDPAANIVAGACIDLSDVGLLLSVYGTACP